MVGENVGSGTEMGRDMLTRRRGALGYDLFLFSVGCSENLHGGKYPWPSFGVGTSRHAHYYEEPFRYATKSREMMTSHRPSAWVASCIRPLRSFGGAERICPSHFGLREGVMGEFRFNVVHLDGHVDDTVLMDVRESLVDGSDWLFGGWGDWWAPYGWRFKTTSSPEYSQNADSNLEPIPGFPLAFDRNK
jgi:hypothetical protein